MPHTEYTTWSPIGESKVMQFSDGPGNYLTEEHSYRGAKCGETTLRISVNTDNWQKCTPYDGVRLEAEAAKVVAKDGSNFHVEINMMLSWERVRQLHGFLGFLLANSGALKMSPSDVVAARQNP